MRKLFFLSMMVILAGCSMNEPKTEDQQKIGMANPASVYCEQLGGTLDFVTSSTGDIAYCTLPSGDKIEEWDLYRKDHQ